MEPLQMIESKPPTEPSATAPTKLWTKDVDFYYSDHKVLHGVTLNVPKNQVTALIGPSGCGKTTYLRLFNRMNDLIPGTRHTGQVVMDSTDLYDPKVDPVYVRTRIGMVFQRPNPFPKSIYENVIYGLRVQGVRDKVALDQKAEESLKKAALWDEVKDNLKKSAFDLSGGQQQRLCIARALAVDPEVLLMDEPTAALDPNATFRIEEMVSELRNSYTFVIVTHNMQQAARIADTTAFFLMGELIEVGPTDGIFLQPKDQRTEDYVRGRFG